MNKYRKIVVGSGIVLAFVGIMLASMWAVGSNPGTTFQPGPKRAQEFHLADTSQAFQQLGGCSNSGTFGMPFAAKQTLHNYVWAYGHQPYTFPDTASDL